MPSTRTKDEIIIDLVTNILREQGNADVMPGQVLRDVSINSNAVEMENIYNQIQRVSTAQSISNANFMTNQELDNLLSNFGIQRRGATKAIGTARFYTSVLPNQVVTIPENTLLSSTSASNGRNINFITRSTQIFDPANSAAYIVTDVNTYYAIDVDIISDTAGVEGNVGAYTITSIKSLNLPFQVTNPAPTAGGVDQESNNDYAVRALSIIVGSNAGTENGYRGLALSQDDVLDALIIGPGDDLMVRDGGFGGKVDIWVIPSALGSTALTPQNSPTLKFNWYDGQQFNNGYRFDFPQLPLDASAPIIARASTSPSGNLIDALLYESRTPAPSGISYVNPSGSRYHYTVYKADDLDTAQSIYANDYIVWNGPEMEYLRQYNPAAAPFSGNSMTVGISYSYVSAVSSLQSTLDGPDTKIITADVLAKEAQKIFVDSTMDVELLPSYKETTATERSTLGLVRGAVAEVINNISLGNTVQESDLVQAAHNVDGVDNVVLDSVRLTQRRPALYDQTAETIVDSEALENQYFAAGSIIIRSV